MGCKQFKVKPTDLVIKNERERNESTASHVSIIQNTSDKPELQSTVIYRKPLPVLRPLVVAPAVSNKSEEVPQYSEPVVSVISKSKDDHNTDNQETSNKLYGPSRPQLDLRETPTSREIIIRSPMLDSVMSDVLEHSSMTIGSIESDKPYPIYRQDISSSADSEVVAHGHDAIFRFMSARPNKLTNQESTHHGNWSEPDDSYSLRDSIVSSVSADSEGSVVDLPRGTRMIFAHPKKPNLQQKAFDRGSSSNSDISEIHRGKSSHSTNTDMKVMTERLLINLRSASTKLSNPDFQSRGVISETTSDSNEK